MLCSLSERVYHLPEFLRSVINKIEHLAGIKSDTLYLSL